MYQIVKMHYNCLLRLHQIVLKSIILHPFFRLKANFLSLSSPKFADKLLRSASYPRDELKQLYIFHFSSSISQQWPQAFSCEIQASLHRGEKKDCKCEEKKKNHKINVYASVYMWRKSSKKRKKKCFSKETS